MYSIKVTDGLGVVLHASANHMDLQDGVLTDAAGLDGTSSELTKEDFLGDGAAIGNMRRPGREVTLEGTLVGSESLVKSALARIPGLFSDKQLGMLEEDRDGAVRTCQVVLDGQPKVSAVFNGEESVADWQLPLFAPDPHLYGSPRQTLLHPVGSGVGLEYPLFAPRVTTRESRRNLMIYPRTTASRAVAGVITSAAAWGSASAPAVSQVADSSAPSGGGYITRITKVDAGTTSGNGALFAAGVDTPVSNGLPYTLSAWIRSSAALQVVAHARFGNRSVVGSNVTLSPNVWTRISVAATADEASGTSRLYVYPAGAVGYPANTTLDLDACQVEAADAATPFFCGATPTVVEGDTRRRYSWAGAPDASESVEQLVTAGPPVLSYGSARNVQRQLVNNGNAIAYPTFQVEVDDGSGFRLTDGEHTVEWVGACSRTVPVIVDMGGTVTVNGLDRSVQLARADWFGIPPHSTRTVRLETLQGGAGSALADVRDTWI